MLTRCYQGALRLSSTMAPWIMRSLSPLYHLFRANDTGVDHTSERYLELATECMEKAQRMSSLQFNLELCQYLAGKLLLAVQIGEESIRSSSIEGIKYCHRSFKHLFRLGKEVEIFIHGCCSDKWVQAAFTLANVFEHVYLLGYDLDMCIVMLRNFNLISSSRMLASSSSPLLSNTENLGLSVTIFTTKELIDGRAAEVEIVRNRSTLDYYYLLEKVQALAQSSNANTLEHQLAHCLLGRLTAAQTQSTPTSVGSSSLRFWEVDFAKLVQLQKLGTGGSGAVYKTEWLGKEVAEKTFFGSDHPEFKNEVSILAKLSHPNIVHLFCYAMDHRQCSIVMELMEGDLFHLMQRRMRQNSDLKSPFTVSEAIGLMLQAAEGMNYLHRNKVVHGDLKSHNVLVKSAVNGDMDYMHVKVSDFGLSKTKERSSTFSNQTLNIGTTRWMAPEVMQSRVAEGEASKVSSKTVEKYPFKSDVYSFGMVCYEILTAEVPFQTTSTHSEVRKMVLNGHRPELPDHCPLSLKTLIQSCWRSVASGRPCFADICVELRFLRCLLIAENGTTDCLNFCGGYHQLRDGSRPNLDLNLGNRNVNTNRDLSVGNGHVEDNLDPILRLPSGSIRVKPFRPRL